MSAIRTREEKRRKKKEKQINAKKKDVQVDQAKMHSLIVDHVEYRVRDDQLYLNLILYVLLVRIQQNDEQNQQHNPVLENRSRDESEVCIIDGWMNERTNEKNF